MHSRIRPENANSTLPYYVARLTVDDVPQLRLLEDRVKLSFWGVDNYRRFLQEFPEYFGCKAVLMCQESQGSLAGFVLARSICDHLEILKLGVSPDWQRRGIGTQLLQTAYAEGIRRGCTRCFLEVRKSNQTAIRFYCNQNFRIAGTRLNYYTDPVEDAWIMERPL